MTDAFTLTPEEPMIREFVRQVAKKYGRDYWLAKSREGTFAEELWQELAKGGYLGMMIPPEYGGGGLGLRQMAVFIEEMGHQGIPLLLIVVGNVMDAVLIARYGSPEMRERYLPPLARGETKFCFALTEPTAGSNSYRTSTSARLDGDEYVLNGQKLFITGVDASDYILVVTRTTSFEDAADKREGLSLLVVDRRSPGITLQPLDIYAAAMSDSGDRAGAAAYANMAKLAAADAATEACDVAIEVHGGSGFSTDVDLITLWPFIRMLRTVPVSREMILNYVGEHVLGLPRSY